MPIKNSLLHSKLTVKLQHIAATRHFYVVAKVATISELSTKYFRFQQYINIEHKKASRGLEAERSFRVVLEGGSGKEDAIHHLCAEFPCPYLWVVFFVESFPDAKKRGKVSRLSQFLKYTIIYKTTILNQNERFAQC